MLSFTFISFPNTFWIKPSSCFYGIFLEGSSAFTEAVQPIDIFYKIT